MKNIDTKTFFDNIAPIWKYINKKEIHQFIKEFNGYSKKQRATSNEQRATSIEFFKKIINDNYKSISQLDELFDNFNSKYSKKNTQKTRNKILVEFATSLDKIKNRKIFHLLTKRQNKIALKRFSTKEAAFEKYQRKVLAHKKQISGAFRCLLAFIKASTQNIAPSAISDLIEFNFSILKNETIPRIRQDILNSSQNVIADYGLTISDFKIDNIITEEEFSTWEKCEALNILELVEDKSFTKHVKNLLDSNKNDDIFVRRHAVCIYLKNISFFPDHNQLLDQIIKDPSPFVRQKLAESLYLINDSDLIEKYYSYLLLEEQERAVRCSALKGTINLLDRLQATGVSPQQGKPIRNGERQRTTLPIERIISPYKALLYSDADPKLIEFALQLLPTCLKNLSELKQPNIWLEEFYPVIEHLHCNAESITTRRIAAQTRELFWYYSNPEAQKLLRYIKNKMASLKSGKSITLSKNRFSKFDDITIGRVLGVISQSNCSIELFKTPFRIKLIKNFKLKFRWWRVLHELRNPSPDKRQTFSHTKGKLMMGQIRSASTIMSELSETKVPGEPLFISTEGNSRPYIPLVDELISASETPETIKIFSPEGITSITPPKSFIKRFFAEVKLTFNFKKYADLRNWREDFQQSPSDYIEKARKLGFDIKITPYPKTKFSSPKIDPKVKRFFSFHIVFPIYLINLFTNLKVYFLSLYQNTLTQLSVFIAALLALFFGRHVALNMLMRKSRAAIPLVIGGWGTRGKSGTERIKAALFASLGCSVVSKTTGCEAMFLYTPPFEKTQEFFLFRPYDKATIWEQFNIFRLADKLEADVFLWECMALSPTYVKILQKSWMKDDFSTITNTYPDHEDIQGPAGWNIAETMTNFIPHKGNLITAEEQHFPYLEVDAKHKKTNFFRVDWKDAILIPSDILERFPYEEHPHNIVLGLKIAELLGITHEYALKEMADHVVPDIGVLKRYPVAKVKNRNLEFLSGMSANERFGCMQNWSRMNLDKFPQEDHPNTWITTVVNNRADRIPRSKAFAKILVEDISVDKHFIIGNNLKGMLGYIKEAWDNTLADFTLWNKEKDKDHALYLFNHKANFLRIPKTEKFLKDFIKSMLKPTNSDIHEILSLWNNLKKMKKVLPPDNAEIISYYEHYYTLYSEYISFTEKIKDRKSKHKNLDKECKQLLWKWFEQKLVVVYDYYATGNQIIETIVKNTPPGTHNMIMALQNIKGTGLDFFYRWQAWENCLNLCINIENSQREQFEKRLRNLSKIKTFEILSLNTLTNLITKLKKINNLSKTEKNLIIELEKKLDESLEAEAILEKNEPTKSESLLIKFIENFIDPGNSIRRRKKANVIYKDLHKGRISYNQAIIELQNITKKQKGGWLKSKLKIKF